MTPKPPTGFDAAGVVDQLYDIALDPETLGGFIDAWNNAGLDARDARQAIESIDRFDQAFHAHLQRAGTFLSRGGNGETGLDLMATLTPFDNLAAFIISKDLTIVACNEGAQLTYGIENGAHLDMLQLSSEAKDLLKEGLAGVFRSDGAPLRLLQLESPTKVGPALFQIRKVMGDGQKETGVALVITTQYHWQDVIGKILEEIFKLTMAEQGVVRGLVEGLGASAIAVERGTSEGTVRSQIKSLMSKMNARTQSEVIRLVLSLRDISEGSEASPPQPLVVRSTATEDWVQSEVWKPFKTLILPDGRKMDYHEMGPVTGSPVLYTHMGYGLVRWHAPMIKLAYRHSLRIICPIRAGYGQSDNIDPKLDVVASTRADTLILLAHLGIARLPYMSNGNDLLFAADFAKEHPDMVSEIIGISARPSLPGDRHYAGMGKWHRFFLSTAKHAPHLLQFTSRAAVSMAKRIGVVDMYRQMNRNSAADMGLINDAELFPVLKSNGELIAGKTTNVSQAYAMEVLASEADWSDLMHQAKVTKTWFVIGAEDPSTDIATISEYRETYPWIDVEVVPSAGQMLIYQHYNDLIPRIAQAAAHAMQ